MEDKNTALIVSVLSAPVAVALVKLLELILRRAISPPPARRTPMEDAVLLIQELQEEVQRLRSRIVELERQLTDALAHIARLERGQQNDARSGPRPTIEEGGS